MPPFQRRVGYKDFNRWRGINKQGSASNIGLNELRDAINVDFSGGQIVSRGGQSKLDGGTLTGCVFGIHDQVAGPYGVKVYALSTTAGSNPALLSYSAADTPVLQVIAQPGLGYPDFNSGLASYGDELHFAGSTTLFKVSPIEIRPGEDVSDVAGLTRGVKLATFSQDISSLAVMRPTLDADERIFVGATTGGIVHSWDGTSVRADSASLGAGKQVLATYREDLYVFGTHYAKKRAAGAYTNISMPVGLTSFRPFDAIVYKDKLYVAGYDRIGASSFVNTILSFDGTTLATARQPASVGSVGEADEGVRSLEVAFGYLFYGWRNPAVGPTNGWIGRFDGTTWTDAHKDLSAQFGNTQVMSLLYANESLFALAWESTGGFDKLVQSPLSTTSGTWTTAATFDEQNTTQDLFAF